MIDPTETTDAQRNRALASTPQQLADGLELVRAVLGKDVRDLADMIDDDERDKGWLQPRLHESRARLLALADLTTMAIEQVKYVAVELCDHVLVVNGSEAAVGDDKSETSTPPRRKPGGPRKPSRLNGAAAHA